MVSVLRKGKDRSCGAERNVRTQRLITNSSTPISSLLRSKAPAQMTSICRSSPTSRRLHRSLQADDAAWSDRIRIPRIISGFTASSRIHTLLVVRNSTTIPTGFPRVCERRLRLMVIICSYTRRKIRPSSCLPENWHEMCIYSRCFCGHQ